MAKKRNVRKILKLNLNPEIVDGWYVNGNQQNHLDRLYQFVTDQKTATCPHEIVEKLLNSFRGNRNYTITIAMRLHDAERLRRRVYQSIWYNSDTVKSTELATVK